MFMSGIFHGGQAFAARSVSVWTLHGTDTHLDMWIGGQGGIKTATDACEDALTSTHAPAVLNPPPGLPVIAGPIFANQKCNFPNADS
jgi:hypothetical protein